MNYKKLRAKYPKFVYESFEYSHKDNILSISFLFKVEPDIIFHPSAKINLPLELFSRVDNKVLENQIFHLGLAEIPSYWKATSSPEIIIKAGKLDDYQKIWWKKLLTKGMGQFFMENEIEYDDNFISIESEGKTFTKITVVNGDKVLIPVGGGKDSAVTLELLNSKFQTSAFFLNPIPASRRIVKIAKVKDQIIVNRSIDQALLELNKKGYLNGHTPFSSYLAFLSVICAYLFGNRHIAFSNERSSDESNTRYCGQEINHQYSKSTQFEKDFREYNKKYLTNINYFSFLRPLHELQISKIFSKMPHFFESFRSCNVGQKTDSWCGSCPKCLSTYILLFPFLGKETLMKVFSKDLFEDLSLYTLLETLILENKVKPFECIGSREELRAALWISSQRYQKLPALLEKAKENKLFSNEQTLSEHLLKDWNNENYLDSEFNEILKKEYE